MPKTLQELSEDAANAINVYDDRRVVLREKHDALDEATAELVAAQKQRAVNKLSAIARICRQDHPATPGKKFSASAADDFAQVDPEYAIYKETVARLERDKVSIEVYVEDARFAIETARLRAELAIALVRAEIASGR